jgi:hypothetical protein
VRTNLYGRELPFPGLVPVHIGRPEPGSDQERLLTGQRRQREHGRREPSPHVPDLAWAKRGLQPRWLWTETSDC